LSDVDPMLATMTFMFDHTGQAGGSGGGRSRGAAP